FNIACQPQKPRGRFILPGSSPRPSALEPADADLEGPPRGSGLSGGPAIQSWPCEHRQQKYLQTNFLIAVSGFPERPWCVAVVSSALLVRCFAFGGDFSAITMAQNVLYRV